MTADPEVWRLRFLAPSVGFPTWTSAQPDDLVFISNEGGVTQAWSVNRTSGKRRQLTEQRVGVEDIILTPDGRGAVWWNDETGDEHGRWVVTSLADGTVSPLLDELPPGWSQGIALAESTVAVAITDDTTYRLYVSSEGEPPRLLRESERPFGLGREWETTGGGLSSDGSLICMRHSDEGDILHFGLRILTAHNGQEIANLVDEGLTVKVGSWSPIRGDQRVTIVHERDGVERPAIWHVLTDERDNLALDLPGPVEVVDWWPDATALLLQHNHDGRSQLYRWNIETRELTLVADPEGFISGAAVRNDSQVWFRSESATASPSVRSTSGEIVLEPPGPRPPPGQPHQSIRFPGPDGQPTHMLLTLPTGQGPFPVVMMVHGGPEWAYPDDYDPWEQALVDNGIAVAKVNYRGSTGGTVQWRTAIHDGNIGFPEVEDVVAGLDWLVAQGVVDSKRAAIEGWSWGGYVTLLAIGLHSKRFAAAIGGIPVCDSVMTHEDCSPPQQAYDLAIMGGSPTQVPERYRERSPSTYLERIRTPVLLIAGEHDSACPIRQVRWYADELRKRRVSVQLHVYDAGHHANSVEEKIHQAEMELAFLKEQLT